MTTAVAPRELRPYQREAADAVLADWFDGIQRIGVVLPTGAGKSTVIATLAVWSYRQGGNVLLMAHRGELLDQMLDAIRAVDPTIPEHDLGIVMAEQDDHHARIVAATLQTLATAHRREALGHRDVILWDEVHHAGADGFHLTFTELGGYTHARMAGFTATMNRDQQGKIGLGDVIEKVSYEKDLPWAIKEGFLVKPRGLTVRIENLNALNDVRNVAGDFHQGQLAEIMEAATEYVVDAIKLHAADRTSIVFAASVDAAHAIADALNAEGTLSAEAITGEMPYLVRQGVYQRYKSGQTRVLVTVMVLTEGADFPMCDCVVLARPTRSRNLYSQMIGRSLRLWEGKNDALVLDLSGSTRSMKLVSLTQLAPGCEVAEVNADGELIELDDALPAEPEPAVRIRRQGPVDMVTIDLLANDTTLWLETPMGVPFIPLRDNEIVFIWPKDGVRPKAGERTMWAVGQINTRTAVGGWADETARYPHDEPVYMDLPEALENAETWIVYTDQALPARDASWRRNQPPSEGQLRYARNLRIVGYDGMTKARLSDEISIKLASAVLDPGMES